MELDNKIDVAEASKLTGYTKQNITHMIRKGTLTALRRGRKYFIDKDDIKNLIKPVKTSQPLPLQ
jgi:excisionase family DNA binding protein